MCGRFALTRSAAELAEWFELDRAPDLELRYNVAPSQPIATVAIEDGRRKLSPRIWGLVPHWSKTCEGGARMINARSETAAEKPAFRDALRRRRCVVPADGFYEWSGARGQRSPHWIYRADGAPMAFAGLYERWRGPGQTDERQTCSILTALASGVVASLHDRAPVILEREQIGDWLDPAVEDAGALEHFLRPAPNDLLRSHPVDDYVNDVRHEGPRCLDVPRQASLF